MKNFEIRRNEQANGIEIYFSCKPSESVRDALKGAGFRRQVRATLTELQARPNLVLFALFSKFPQSSGVFRLVNKQKIY